MLLGEQRTDEVPYEYELKLLICLVVSVPAVLFFALVALFEFRKCRAVAVVAADSYIQLDNSLIE
jgi:hypothetical protein